MSGTGILRFLPKALAAALATVLVAAPVLAPSPAQAVTVAVYEGNTLQYYVQDGEGGTGTGAGRRVADGDIDAENNENVANQVDAGGEVFHSRAGSPNQNNVTAQELVVTVSDTGNSMTVSGQLRIEAAPTDNPITIYAYMSDGPGNLLTTPEVTFTTSTSGDQTNDGVNWEATVGTRIATWVTTSNISQPTSNTELINNYDHDDNSATPERPKGPYAHWVGNNPSYLMTARCYLYAAGRRDCNEEYVEQDSSQLASGQFSAHALIRFNSGLTGNIDFKLVFEYSVIPLPPALWAMGVALGLFGFAGVSRRRRAKGGTRRRKKIERTLARRERGPMQ